MKLADTMPFSQDLLAPLHSEVYARPGAAPGGGDISLASGWQVAAEGDDVAVRAAADYLRGNLVHSLGAELGGDRTVTLRVDPSVGEHPEDHVIECTPEGLVLRGAGAPGVLHAAFGLVQAMRERGGPFVPQGTMSRQPLFKHRIHRSPLSPFYVDELTGFTGAPFESRWNEVDCSYPAFIEEDAGPGTYYDDAMLLRLAEHGFNGLWIRGALRHFAKVDAFPEFGAQAEAILGALNDLCARAQRFGMKVFLYLNEPMGIDTSDPFWEKYPQCQGLECSFKPVSFFCSSSQEVKDYLYDSTRYVFKQVPDLAGVLLITASEYPSHCWSHTRGAGNAEQLAELKEGGRICERCAERTPQEVIGEIVTLIRDGVKSAKPDAEIVAWNWSWNMYEPDPQRGVLEALPDDVILMGDYERGTPTKALDFAYLNDEYSIKIVGPSPRFSGVADFQRERELPVYARIQLGTTHENPTVPYLPAMHKIAAKYQSMVTAGVTGMMTCWNFGNMPSLGTELCGEMSWEPQPVDIDAALLRLATRHFGPDAAADAVRGWRRMSEAQDAFPGSIPVMYYGPVSRGPALPFVFDIIDHKLPRSWMLDTVIEGDRLDWVSPFGAEKVLECLRACAVGWAEGAHAMEAGLAKTSGPDRERFERELGVAKMQAIQLASAANLTDFLLLRNAFHAGDDVDEKRSLLDRIDALLEAEADNARAAIPLLQNDSRLGWHGEAYGYMITPELIETKLAGLHSLRKERLPAEREKLAQPAG